MAIPPITQTQVIAAMERFDREERATNTWETNAAHHYAIDYNGQRYPVKQIIAMAAGIPIVPIVIRNAEVIAARDSSTFNPGTVDVAVYPPIPVGDWTLDELPERIAEVRQIYLDTLKSWPDDELPSFPIYDRPRSRTPKIRSVPKKSGAAGANSGTGRAVKGRP